MSIGYAEFELDLTKALLAHLPSAFNELVAAPLTAENVLQLPPGAQGVYTLFENGIPTYIGKTDATHGFRDRLSRHVFTLSARKNLDLGSISFKAVRVMVFTTINVESTLIEHFIGENPLSWQNSGFGSNDPGHRREGQEPSAFDVKYPVNIDLPQSFVSAGQILALDALIALKRGLPYDLRYETDLIGPEKWVDFRKGHVDQRVTTLSIPRVAMTFRELLVEMLRQLPDGWVATIFPGRVILYKESTKYTYALEQIRRT